MQSAVKDGWGIRRLLLANVAAITGFQLDEGRAGLQLRPATVRFDGLDAQLKGNAAVNTRSTRGGGDASEKVGEQIRIGSRPTAVALKRGRHGGTATVATAAVVVGFLLRLFLIKAKVSGGTTRGGAAQNGKDEQKRLVDFREARTVDITSGTVASAQERLDARIAVGLRKAAKDGSQQKVERQEQIVQKGVRQSRKHQEDEQQEQKWTSQRSVSSFTDRVGSSSLSERHHLRRRSS